MYVRMGIGNGTLLGLLINPAYLQKNTAVPKATGLNAAAESLGDDLSASLVGLLNLKALLPSLGALGPASLALSQGLGSGGAAGLGLKVIDTAAYNITGFNVIAGNFG